MPAVWGSNASRRFSSQVYVHADLAIKEQALARTAPVNDKPGRYRPPDSLLAFLEAL
jgi:integrase/recombinase XerD